RGRRAEGGRRVRCAAARPAPARPRHPQGRRRGHADHGAPSRLGAGRRVPRDRAPGDRAARRDGDAATAADDLLSADMASAAGSAIVPIFPLPDVTFFPRTLLPLHVFESRYRAMVMDTLARDRRLCVVKLQPGYEATYAGRPAVHAVGAGVARVADAIEMLVRELKGGRP